MKRLLITLVIIAQFSLIIADQYEDLYSKGQVAQLRQEIFSKPHFDQSELPRAAYYESLVTSKNFDQTLQELIEGFPEMEYKDQVNFKLGVINFFKRKYSQSEFYFSKIEDDSKIPEYYYWLSRLYFMKQEHKQSSKYASMFIEKCSIEDHKYELSYYMLIENSITQGNYQKGIVLAEELLRNKKDGINKAYLFYRIGYSYEKVDNINLAVENYRKSFIENPYGQYASIIEERLYELRKSVDNNLDISFLYTKNYASDDKSDLIAHESNMKIFNVNELVRSDTSSVLSKFFANNYQDAEEEVIEIEDYKAPAQKGNKSNEDSSILNKRDREVVKSTSLYSEIGDNKDQESRGRQEVILENVNDDGALLERPTNIQTEDYIYLMNKPLGKYFIQIGRFTKKEYAINRVKELFYLQKTWNIIRDVKGEDITYVIWSQPYDNANLAKQDIAYFKSKQVDCFLIAND
jgi:tetratricopeptide (TPR) repeat protein